jgi:16S rRNA (guanine527-N7)-methyltransferase
MPAKPSAAEDRDRGRALALTPVSHETAARLDGFVTLLRSWQPTINLVAGSTLPVLWTRHIADSLQLLRFAPNASHWVDLGSGAGFPAIPIACVLKDRPGASVTLIESDSRKAAFLRQVIRTLALPARVQIRRVESLADMPDDVPEAEIVTARALAPLVELLAYAEPWLRKGAKGVFPKGQDVEAELTESAKSWNIEADLRPSLTDFAARIVLVTRAVRR